MQIIDKNIDELIPYEKNPRKNDEAVDKVAASLEAFGWQQPIVIDHNDVIVAGHTRWKAAKKLGIKIVPVKYADELTDEEIKAYRLVDNKTAEFAGWDFEALDLELKGLEDIDMSNFGFLLDENDLRNDLKNEIIEDDFDATIPQKPKSKVGNIYRLGRHRLMCGDSTEINSVEKLMDGIKADLFLTDPPYNVDYNAKEQRLAGYRPNKRVKQNLNTGIRNDKMKDSAFRNFLGQAFDNALKNMKQGAAFYIWYAEWETYNFLSACKDVGLDVRQNLVWKKSHLTLGRQDYQWIHEPCLYGWKSGSSHAWYSDRKQTTVLEFNKPNKNELHPTMKPVALFDYLIKNSSKQGDIVLDLFGGSGTTIIACEQNERCAYVMELDPKYIDVIIKRWEDFTGEKAELIEGD